MTSTQIMKPSDEAQNVEPTNVQSAAASHDADAASTATPPAIAEPAEPARHLARARARRATSR